MDQNIITRANKLKSQADDLDERYRLSQLPPSKIILDDLDVMYILKVSKRKLAQLRADRLIRYHPTGGQGKGKRAGKIYYTLQGLLDYINTTTVHPISQTSKL